MSAAEEIRQRAELFGWEQRRSQDQHDVLIRGDAVVDVLYRGDGSVHSATLYQFFSIDNLHERERTRDAHKKTTVIAWLAEAA